MISRFDFIKNVIRRAKIYVDHLYEKTADHGVDVDGVLLKDGGGTFTDELNMAVNKGLFWDAATRVYGNAAINRVYILGRCEFEHAVASGYFGMTGAADTTALYISHSQWIMTRDGAAAYQNLIHIVEGVKYCADFPRAGDIIQLADKKTVFLESTELTISNDAITVVGKNNIVDTEGDAAADILDVINGGVDGMVIVIRAASEERTVHVEDATATTGNIHCVAGIDLDEVWKSVLLMYVGSISEWIVLSRNT